jgi:hypothetical protein
MAGTRADRDLARGRRAAAAIRRTGGSALQAACAQIEATFSPALRHSMLKDRVAALMRRGPADPEVRTRYRRLAECRPLADLHVAIVLVECLRRAECEAQAAAMRVWGACSRPRFALMILDELRLILRMLRRFAPTRYRGVIAATLADEDETPAHNGAADAGKARHHGCSEPAENCGAPAVNRKFLGLLE